MSGRKRIRITLNFVVELDESLLGKGGPNIGAACIAATKELLIVDGAEGNLFLEPRASCKLNFNPAKRRTRE